MNLRVFYNNISVKHSKLVPKLDVLANHLIVIFAFSVPILIQVRRISLFLILVLFLIRGKYFTYFRESLRDPIVLAFSLYFIVHVVWLFGTNDYEHANKRVHDAAFLLFPLLFSTFIDKRYIPRIFYAFLLGMTFSILFSYGLFFELIPPQPFDKNQGTSINPTPIFNHTMYGYMLAVTSVLFLQRIYYENNKYLIAIYTLLFILSSANVFIILSRTGYILYLVLIVFILALLYRKRIVTFTISTIIICAIALLAAANFSTSFKNRIQNTFDSIYSIKKHDDYLSSVGERYAIYSSAIKLIPDHHLLGMGTGDDIVATRKELEANYPEIVKSRLELQHLHNEYLSAILQFGWIGFFVFLNIIFQLLRYNNINVEKENTAKILGVSIALLSISEIFVIGLGALLTAVTLSSLILRNYYNTVEFSPINLKVILYYALAIVLFQVYFVVTT